MRMQEWRVVVAVGDDFGYPDSERWSRGSMTAEQTSITLDPNDLAGKPVVRGTRLSVEFIIGSMADEWSETDILASYPGLTREDILACLAYARETLGSERVFPGAA